MLLNELKAGQSAIIEGFGDTGSDYSKKLLSMGITKGAMVKVVRFAPLGDPMEISIRGSRVSLRKNEASIIIVNDVQEEQSHE